ncbi:hypothetical protein [Haloarchaeobius amylolyticus]|uniref:hypothetical protein n=1 Tax=Haloarchaeobius amylolyticus TaxID=1198296 RepID=UPI00226F680C|nr:hypothetical protein [Haloarchaeobius amylolyticus]
MQGFDRNDAGGQGPSTTRTCSNCNQARGRERDLVCGGDRSVQIVLCPVCLDAYLDEEWIHRAQD